MNRTRFSFFVCLAVCMMLFIQNSFMGGLHPWFLPAVIIIFGLYGLRCAYVAIRGMNRHLRHFASLEKHEAEKKRFYPDVKGLDVVAYCRELSEWLESGTKNQPSAGMLAPEQHFKERVRSLVETQKQAEKAQVDIDLPSMGDLGSLTDMAEQSSACVVGLNVTISFLLILGILGTLLGIHGSMSDEDSLQKLSELGPALLPSGFAVAITVILMVAKGIYQYKRDHYMAALNRFTLLHLIPHLQRDGNDDEVMGQVGPGEKIFFDAVTYVAGFAEAVEQSKAHLVQEVNSATKQLRRLLQLKAQLKQKVEAEKEQVSLQQQHGKLLHQATEQMEGQMQWLSSTCQQTDQLSHMYTRTLEERSNTEDAVAGGLLAEAEQVLNNVPTLTDNCKAMAEVPAHIRSICATETQVRRTKEEADMLNTAMLQRSEAWQQVRAEMEELRRSASEAGNTASAMATQALSQISQTDEFLRTVVPQGLVQQMDKLSTDMEKTAVEFHLYAVGMEKLSRQPLLLWQEWLGLGLLGGAVVLKLIVVIL